MVVVSTFGQIIVTTRSCVFGIGESGVSQSSRSRYLVQYSGIKFSRGQLFSNRGKLFSYKINVVKQHVIGKTAELIVAQPLEQCINFTVIKHPRWGKDPLADTPVLRAVKVECLLPETVIKGVAVPAIKGVPAGLGSHVAAAESAL
ncbi:MAG: hypothetical protein MUO43_13505, partial [Desulfobacterales bacterium]|nr:hypothetical protein [Desulfobacterales bacterium]